MDEFRNPLHDVPVEMHELMQPLLDLSKDAARACAEQTITLHPLPWRGVDSDAIITMVFENFEAAVRRGMPELPDIVIVAMCRHLVATFSDRIEETWKARSGDTAGRA